MDWNLKKMWPTAAASLVAITSLLQAADDMQLRNLENRVNALEQRKGANGIINPSARPGVRNGSDVFVTAAALFWKPNETGLSYAIQENGDNTECVDCGQVLEARSQYRWGWKVGLGYNMPHDGWDVYLNWTHFRASNNHFDCCEEECDECEDACGGCNVCDSCDRDDDDDGLIMFPIVPNFSACALPEGMWSFDAFSKWKLRLDMLDLELGRDFFVSKFLSLRPHAGLRGLSIRQNQNSVFLGIQTANFAGLDFDTIDTPDATLFTFNKEKFQGIGPRAGIDTLWSFGRGWGLYGNAAISLIYGRLRVSHKDSVILGPTVSPCDDCECDCDCDCPDENTLDKIKGNRGRCKRQFFTRAVTDIALGLAWDHQFRDDRFHLGFALGWEHHMFFGMNQFLRFHSSDDPGSMTTNQGDLATQGWTLTGRFDF